MINITQYITPNIIAIFYLIASILFILSLKGLSSPRSARKGNLFGIIGMGIAIGITILSPELHNKLIILSGISLGAFIGMLVVTNIKMTSMPQLVAGFHSFVGLAATLIALSTILSNTHTIASMPLANLIELVIGATIGAITFSGSVIAFGKLQGLIASRPLRVKGLHIVNAILALTSIGFAIHFCYTTSLTSFIASITIAFVLGVSTILPVGGADMPVVVSMLNSYSGWAAVGIGFSLNNSLLIITGALVGASGAILSYIMCKAMNRSIWNVIFGSSASSSKTYSHKHAEKTTKTSYPEDAAYLLKNASSVIVIPGYGMAAAHAQHVLKELCNILGDSGVDVRYAIHPVAGRMPGHMNVLLAEAGIDYEKVFELDDINRDFTNTDVVIVIGANDITNPSAKTDPDSPIYGMPVFDVDKAKTVLFIKRGMSPGYAGVDNELFFKDNTYMLFGDAKDVVERTIKELKNL